MSDVQNGYIFVTEPNNGVAQLIDQDYEPFYSYNQHMYSMYNSNVFPNKSVLVEVNTSGGAEFMRLHDFNGNPIWQINQTNYYLLDKLDSGEIQGPNLLNIQLPEPYSFGNLGIFDERHHDAYPLLNGNILIHGYHFIPANDRQLLGYQGQNNDVDYSYVMEIEPVGVNQCIDDNSCNFNVVWEWYMVDHVIQDNMPHLSWNYVDDINQHINKLDVNMYSESTQGESHINTIHYDVERNEVIISSRGYDEFYVISKDTNEITFRCCNPEQYGGEQYEWGYTMRQHGVNVIPPNYPSGGDILIYNNISHNALGEISEMYYEYYGAGQVPFFSSVIKLEPNIQNNNYQIENVNGKQRYSISDVQSLHRIMADENSPMDFTHFYCPTMSGVFMLPNGNIWLSNNPLPAGCQDIPSTFSEDISIGTRVAALEIKNPFTNPEIVSFLDSDGIIATSTYMTEGRILKYIPGCTDPSAINFDIAAHYMYMIDDGSCIYEGAGDGDVNFDSNVDILDVITIVNAVLGNLQLTQEQIQVADSNGDGQVDILDVITLVNNIIALPTTPFSQQQQLTNELERLQNVNIDENQTQNINAEVEIKPIPNSFNYTQSDNQAFYFFDTQKLLNQRNLTSSPNKVLVATCNDFVVGYTRMDTRYIDVEAMGVTSGIIDTENYCASGEKPNFFIQDLETNTQHRLKNNLIEPFIPNATYNVNINELDQVNITINEEVDKLEQASKDKNWNSVDRIIRNLKSQFDKNNK